MALVGLDPMPKPASIRGYREFLKDTIRKQVDFRNVDQHRGVPPPPIQKPAPPEAARVELPRPNDWKRGESVDLLSAIGNRRSRRSYSSEPLSLEDMAVLLWATQGLRGPVEGGAGFRTVPSAGCRHAFETYVAMQRVEAVEPGFYRYLPLDHALTLEFADAHAAERVAVAAFGQSFLAGAAAVFLWAAIPYRMEWRYGEAASRTIALDAGHVCQNLYLACEAIGAGTCAVAAYDQQQMDRLLRVDGEDEFTVYLAAVGKR
jgi:SagB-type dehydrogenase family enzyme